MATVQMSLTERASALRSRCARWLSTGTHVACAALGVAYQASKTFYLASLHPLFVDLVTSFLLGAWWLGLVVSSPRPTPVAEICSAFVFMETHPEDGERYEVTPLIRTLYKYGRVEEWETPLRESHDLPDAGWRLEVRYKNRNHKWRMVARPGVTGPLPDLLADCGPKQFPRIIHAVLKNGRTGNKVDVTSRVLKYLGPHNDFHGSSLRVWDFFPNDDVEFHRDAGYTLEVVLADLKTREYSYGTNEQISF